MELLLQTFQCAAYCISFIKSLLGDLLQEHLPLYYTLGSASAPVTYARCNAPRFLDKVVFGDGMGRRGSFETHPLLAILQRDGDNVMVAAKDANFHICNEERVILSS